MRVAVLGLVVACSPSPIHLIDGGPEPIDYTLHVGVAGTRPDMPQVFIDDVETTMFQQVYPDLDPPIEHVVELRYAGQVLARMAVSARAGDCGSPDEVWTRIEQNVEALVSGDLRYWDDYWGDEGGYKCVGDGFGLARCLGCQQGERCAPRVLRAQPLFTQMACVPIGSAGSGAPCTLTDDPAGAYDDCGENLVCIAGTCTPFCSANIPVAEYPPELTATCP